jgi:hypothetical protein
MGPLIGALVVVVFVVGGFGGLVGFILWWARRQQQQRDQAWGAAAAQLGLGYAPGRIYGRLHGQPVQLTTVTRGSGKSQQTYTVASSPLELPLDLGLSVRPHGFFEDLFRGGGDILVGDPLFDDRFLVQADEEQRARAVLTPRLRGLIRPPVPSGTAIALSDSGCVVECRGVCSFAPWLTSAIELAAQASAELAQARASVPVASPLAPYASAWASYARARGLQGFDTPLCMWGTLEGVVVRAYAVRVSRLAYALEIQVGLGQPLGLGLQIRPQHTFDRLSALFGAQDLELGDPPFDAAFVVKAHEPGAIRELLDAPTRAALLAVHQGVGALSLSDDGLTVRLPLLGRDPSVVPRTAEKLAALGEALSRRRAQQPALGPYR